jgi:hypothetical protein
VRADFRFLRAGKGTSRFARVVLTATPAAQWETHLQLQGDQAAYHGEAIRAGIALASAAHAERGGPPHRIELEELIETAVDTMPDAVECAVAVAAWIALGHDEGEACFAFADGRWQVSFRGATLAGI